MPATDPLEDLALIRDAARRGGEIALGYFGNAPQVWMKPGESPVTAADYAVDRYLRDTLLAARPSYGWLSEETLADASRLTARRSFVVDPIDGTRAFIDGKDVWCISIAVVEDGRTVAGVLDCPAKGECFAAAASSGATLNGEGLAVRTAPKPPLLAGPKAILDVHRSRFGDVPVHPYVPSLAYRIAMLAAGRIDGTFVKARSHDWDLAAADLILSEAGGGIRDARGQPLTYAGADSVKGMLAAGAGALLEDLVSTIREMDKT